MLGIIVDHKVRPERRQEGLDVIYRNGNAMKSMPGFVSRLTMSASEDGLLVLTTVTVWKSEADFKAWGASPTKKAIPPAAEGLWAVKPQPRFFEVLDD